MCQLYTNMKNRPPTEAATTLITSSQKVISVIIESTHQTALNLRDIIKSFELYALLLTQKHRDNFLLDKIRYDFLCQGIKMIFNSFVPPEVVQTTAPVSITYYKKYNVSLFLSSIGIITN